jgi:glycosyltransferase involved in cell wall biosynthesis
MHPTKTIQRLAGPDTIVTGYVPDIRPYLNEATVCVVPLRIARGVQNKVLEAMAMNVPVVATSMANAGIRAKDGQDILLADDPEEFSKSVVALLKDSYFRDRLAMSARQLVDDSFSWERSLKKVDEAIGLATCL